MRSVAHLHDAPDGRVVVVHYDTAGAVVVVPRPLLFSYLCCLAIENRHHALIAFSTRALIPANAGHHHAALSMGFFQRLTTIPRQTGRRTLLVDDLGEGLDFSRSKKLSKILFDYCQEHDIQLIVTSNDNFLMNAVNLDYWVILQREGEHTSTISKLTHPEMFLKFKKMGLNNFDMLSTDFIIRYLNQSKE